MLLTKENRRRLPKLYSQDGAGGEAVAEVKIFDPCGRFTFYATEFDGEDTFFGFTVSPLGADCDELSYASLSEMEKVKGRFGIGLERDRYFTPTALKDIPEYKAKQAA
jgi:hypothetical protein